MASLITSRSNPAVVLAASLKDKKFRDRHGLFFVEGEKMFAECVANRLPITYVFVAESAGERLLSRVETAIADSEITDASVLLVADHVFEKISSEKSHEPWGIGPPSTNSPILYRRGRKKARARRQKTAPHRAFPAKRAPQSLDKRRKYRYSTCVIRKNMR